MTKSLLRFLTCGNVDGGKSTLVGRMLDDASLVPADQSKSIQEQSTDVAWRYFQTRERKFVMADVPGHEQHTSILASAASRSDLALILVDAEKGVMPQTRRHTAIMHLMGIRKVAVAVNKMDLAGWSERAFINLQRDFLEFARSFGIAEPVFVPVSALHGDNLVHRSTRMQWYTGPTLLEHLETVELETASMLLRSPVVVRTLTVASDRFEANLVWMAQQPLLAGRRYELRIGTSSVPATMKRLIHRLNLETMRQELATRLEKNDIGQCEVMTERPVQCDLYANCRETGSFILIDRISNAVVATGMVTANETRKVFWEKGSVDKRARAHAKGQHPRVIWFTGLSGAGKSTIADAVEQALFKAGMHTYLIDGDNIRHGISRDLGFSVEDRIENTRRVGELAKLMTDAGLIVLVSLISPFRAERRMVRDLFEPGEFFEVYMSAPLEVCESRDTKGLYRLARDGKLQNFTGISSPYESPEAAELVLDTSIEPIEHCVHRVVDLVMGR